MILRVHLSADLVNCDTQVDVRIPDAEWATFSDAEKVAEREDSIQDAISDWLDAWTEELPDPPVRPSEPQACSTARNATEGSD